MGLALHPDFATTPYVYAMYVVDNPSTGIPSGQRVVRFRDMDDIGQDYTVIIDNLPALTISFHNGGRIAFGPDGMLYVSIGDTGEGELAQDPNRLEGSILRYNPDGSIPSDNPIPRVLRSMPSVCAMSSASPSNLRPDSSTLQTTAPAASTK